MSVKINSLEIENVKRIKAVQLSMVEKKELIGGFVIRTGDREYDRSILGRYKSLRQKLVMR